MLGVERRQYIFRLLQERGNITVVELSRLCEVGEETIRRDLNRMSNEGLIEKIYGGATLKKSMHQVLPVYMREAAHSEEKKRIAKKCASLIEEGDTIFIDGSTTSMEIVNELKRFQQIIVITNSAEIACRLSDTPAIKVIGIGGTLRSRTRTFVGQQTVNMIGTYFADKVIICCDGADLKTGITDANEQEAEVRRAMIAHAGKNILAADQSKFDKTSFVSIADLKDFDMVVTDKPLSEIWEENLKNSDISIHYGDA